MDSGEWQGSVPPGGAKQAPNSGRRALRRLADKARSCLTWHSERMKNDPEYRATVRYLTKLLAERPGRLGRTVRDVVAAHLLLGNAL